MQSLLGFFEEFDELVYLADIRSHELLYMNRALRDSLGYRSHTEYRGRKCYEVLQGESSSCTFCTSQKLVERGHVLSWVHSNPILKKRYLIKDSQVEYEGRPCRLEIAIDMDAQAVGKTPYCYSSRETVLNECLRRISSTPDPEEALEQVLAYLGETFLCDRTYIFEISDDNLTDNTYEWCSKGVMPQKEILQKVPLSGIDWWMQIFQENKVVLIEDLEEIRTTYPVAYAVLKPQDVTVLAAGPISIEGEVVGFLGVDNPSSELISVLVPLLNVIGYFASTLLRRRDMFQKLKMMSFHDSLTGAYNRNAMFEHGLEKQPLHTLGVIYCDVTGLKQINDSQGHDVGDQRLKHCFHLIQRVLDTPWIYRTGGDEFVAVLPDCEEKSFTDRCICSACRLRRTAVTWQWDMPGHRSSRLI